jgi:hypothetical protein
VADLAGGDWPARARRAAVKLSSPGATASFDKETAQRALLRALRAWFQANPDRTGIGGEEAVKHLVSEEVEWDFADWWRADVQALRFYKPRTRLRGLLKGFGVHPVKIKAVNARGYRLDDLQPIFDRYLGTGTIGTAGTALISEVPTVPPVPPVPLSTRGSEETAVAPNPFPPGDDSPRDKQEAVLQESSWKRVGVWSRDFIRKSAGGINRNIDDPPPLDDPDRRCPSCEGIKRPTNPACASCMRKGRAI